MAFLVLLWLYLLQATNANPQWYGDLYCDDNPNPDRDVQVSSCVYYCQKKGEDWKDYFHKDGTPCENGGRKSICLQATSGRGCYSEEHEAYRKFFQSQNPDTESTTHKRSRRNAPTTPPTTPKDSATPKKSPKQDGEHRKKCKNLKKNKEKEHRGEAAW